MSLCGSVAVMPPSEFDLRVGANLRRLRDHRNLSQTDVIQLLENEGISGFHQTTLSRIENGERTLRLNEAAAFASILGVQIGELMAAERLNLLEIEVQNIKSNLQMAAMRTRDGLDSLLRGLMAAYLIGLHFPEFADRAISAAENAFIAAMAGVGSFGDGHLDATHDWSGLDRRLDELSRFMMEDAHAWAEAAHAAGVSWLEIPGSESFPNE